MRVAIFDDEDPIVGLVIDLVEGLGHEVVGVADTSMDAVNLVEHGRPDVVVLDVTVGSNNDFNVLSTASRIGVPCIVFSRSFGLPPGDNYTEPLKVTKPDLVGLEAAFERLGDGTADAAGDRRAHRAGEARGPRPTGLGDAGAFYAAVGEAEEGEALAAVVGPGDAVEEALRLVGMVRSGDRVSVAPWAVVVLLTGDGSAAGDALRERVAAMPGQRTVVATVISADESGPIAFDRLKQQTIAAS